MTPQDWEDIEILKCALRDITNTLSEYVTSNIHAIHDNTPEIERCGNMIIRISKLVDGIYSDGKHICFGTNEDDE